MPFATNVLGKNYGPTAGHFSIMTKFSKDAKNKVVEEMNEMNLSKNYFSGTKKKGKKTIYFKLYYVTKQDFVDFYS